jgi:hypothetical protein
VISPRKKAEEIDSRGNLFVKSDHGEKADLPYFLNKSSSFLRARALAAEVPSP